MKRVIDDRTRIVQVPLLRGRNTFIVPHGTEILDMVMHMPPGFPKYKGRLTTYKTDYDASHPVLITLQPYSYEKDGSVLPHEEWTVAVTKDNASPDRWGKFTYLGSFCDRKRGIYHALLHDKVDVPQDAEDSRLLAGA